MIREFDLNDDLLGYAMGKGVEVCDAVKYWMEPNDLECDWYRHQKDVQKNRYLTQQSWMDPCAIRYDLNHYGFRGKDFTGQYDAIALGCSYTFGFALPDRDIWHARLEKTLGIKIANLGVNGASINSCFRILQFWLPKLKPKWIFLLIPHLNRLEVLISKDSEQIYRDSYHPGCAMPAEKFLLDYWLTDYNALLERQRSLLSMRYLVDQQQGHLIALPIEQAERDLWPPGDFARDFAHPGPIFQQRVADFFLTEIQKYHGQE